MFMVLPAAVLFATVFAIGSLTRHSEITAAKASGISFYRFIAPIFVGALFATLLGLVLGEVAPATNRRRMDLLETHKYASTGDRYNFAYAAEAGRTYNIAALHQQLATLEGVEIERKGGRADYPSYIVSATGAKHRQKGGWLLSRGTMHIIPDNQSNLTFAFDSLIDKHFTERPENLAVSPATPAEMEFRELGRFIKAMERSGADVNELRVERMLKIAIPVTSLVILLFGAPLATSTKRGGAAYGIGVSLATTVIFLMLIQLTKAIGGKGLLTPELAAWLPSLIFGTIGIVLFTRIRT
jgi:lipopolysaccharide export system permease protein